WLRRRPWAIPLFYVLGLGTFGTVGVLFLAERFGWSPPTQWSGNSIFQWLGWVVLPAWALGALVLLARQARTYPEPKGRQQASLVAAGLLPVEVLCAPAPTKGLAPLVP